MNNHYLFPLYVFCLLTLLACAPTPPEPTLTATEAPLEVIPTKISPHDGVTLLYVPAGEFVMGTEATHPLAQEDESPQHTVTLDAFWIDQVEITNERYTRCVEANVCEAIVSPRENMTEQPNFPVQGVAWPEAVKYCEWVGRRLPTEAEWEKAARGTDARLYPWGDRYTDTLRVNIDFRVGDVNEVGSNPDDKSPYNVLDMAGNLSEWVYDRYDANYYASSPAQNPPGPSKSGLGQRVTRGGKWNAAPKAARTANRFWSFPYRDDFSGFRCAEDG